MHVAAACKLISRARLPYLFQEFACVLHKLDRESLHAFAASEYFRTLLQHEQTSSCLNSAKALVWRRKEVLQATVFLRSVAPAQNHLYLIDGGFVGPNPGLPLHLRSKTVSYAGFLMEMLSSPSEDHSDP